MRNYRLHFIRHGLTQANKQGLYVGRSDYELCQEGILELVELKTRYEYPPVEAVYTSPLTRCVQTAGILYPDTQLVLEDGLIELDFGEFEGKTYDHLKDDPDFRNWMEDSGRYAPRGGEDWQSFTTRITQAVDGIFRDMQREQVEEVAVVTHGGVIMTLMATLGLPRRPFPEWAVGNGRGFTVLLNPQLWMRDQALEIAGYMPHGATSARVPAQQEE